MWLRIQHRKIASLAAQTFGKLAPKFYGPYQITERIGDVSYRLKLPPKAKVHDIFHVSLLKQFIGTPPQCPPPLPTLYHGKVTPTPIEVLRARKARGLWQVLVRWEGLSAADTSWEDVQHFKEQYPSFQLEDKLFLHDEGDVMWGRTYIRRRHRLKANTSGLDGAAGIAHGQDELTKQISVSVSCNDTTPVHTKTESECMTT